MWERLYVIYPEILEEIIIITVAMSTTSDTALSTAVPRERSSSPFEIRDQIKPRGIKGLHTSISNLPELPPHIKSTAQRKRIEIEKLKAKVKLLGSKVCS